MGARTYDPKTGSFTTSDTFRSAPGAGAAALAADPLTRNTYVNGDPINLIDPTGHAYAPLVDGYGCDAKCARWTQSWLNLQRIKAEIAADSKKGWFHKHTGISAGDVGDAFVVGGQGAVNFGAGFVDSYTGIVGDVTFGKVEVPKIGQVYHGAGLDISYKIGVGTGYATQVVEGAAGVRAGFKAIRNAGGIANAARNVATKVRTAASNASTAIKSKIRPRSGGGSGAADGAASRTTYAISEAGEPLAGSRATGIARAWAQERELLNAGGGTRNWTADEARQLWTQGKVDGYTGHHINSVGAFPEWAGDPRNIRFLTNARGTNEHLYSSLGHGGSWGDTSGDLIDRVAMIRELLG